MAIRPMRYQKLSAAAAALAALLLALYHWRFTHVSLQTGFGHDDLMNLYFVWREPFSDVVKANFFFRTSVIRPFGALFYSTTLSLWGFDGFAFRVICYAVLWLNLPLTYIVVNRLTRSREIGVTATLLHCVHSCYFPMYYGSGNCYDVFAFFFYYAAFALSLRARHVGRLLTFAECAGLAVLFACAVNSKESAASLPAILLAYELLHNRPRSFSWAWREARGVLITGCIALVFCWARFTGPNNLLAHPDYSPVFTLTRYLECTAHYLNELSATADVWSTVGSGGLLAAMVVMAAIARRKTLMLAWALVVIGSAPMAFVSPRGLAQYYIPVLGYALFLSVALVRSREFLVRSRRSLVVLGSQAALFLILLTGMWKWQSMTERSFADHWVDLRHIESAAAQFASHPEWFRPNTSLLLANDPFGQYEWASTFIASVVGNERSVQVQNLAKLDPKPTREDLAKYTTVVTYKDGRYVESGRFALR